mgnify:CR=1 FL=1
MSRSRSSPFDLTVNGQPVPVYTAPDWEEVTLLHTAVTAGDLSSGIGTSSKLSDASAFLLPRNIPLQITVEPGTIITAQTDGDARRLNLIATPLPLSQRLLCALEKWLKTYL